MESLISKAKLIRLLILDIDGVLSSGKLFYTADGISVKDFHVHDGQGIKLLQKAGIEIAIITAKESDIITRRMQDLGIRYVYQNQSNKLIAYQDIKQKLKLTDEQIAYVGDDLPDLCILARTGLAITVAGAPKIIHQYVHWTTNAKGGRGAVREVCDFILQAQDAYQVLIESFLAKDNV
jgi:3-deoxy-D-manno-octulosonate 8-phosphate phosphatase (KDO 8-P phosphatase)